MKFIKIENNKGFYWDGDDYQEIDKINKEGLLALLNSAEKDDFELDQYDENLLGNRAHQIIYENIYSKLVQFLDNKDQFKEEVDKKYKEAIGKYEVEVNDEDENIEADDELEEAKSQTSEDDPPF